MRGGCTAGLEGHHAAAAVSVTGRGRCSKPGAPRVGAPASRQPEPAWVPVTLPAVLCNFSRGGERNKGQDKEKGKKGRRERMSGTPQKAGEKEGQGERRARSHLLTRASAEGPLGLPWADPTGPASSAGCPHSARHTQPRKYQHGRGLDKAAYSTCISQLS